MSALGGTFHAAAEAIPGITSGKLQIVGSVVRHASGPLKGKIHSYLQETGLVGSLLDSFKASGSTLARTTLATGNPAIGAGVAATQLASSVAANVQNEFIRQGVNRVEGKVDALAAGMGALQNIGIANLALSATGIGVSLVGFGIMNARLSKVEENLSALTEGTDRILAAIERIRQDQLAAEFAFLRSQVNLFEEAWLMTDTGRAAQVWLGIALATRPHQERFEDRARELLLDMPPEYALADPMIDAMSLAGGLRVACLMACNESAAATAAANENARQIESLTGSIGKADLVLARLPAGIDRASQEWEKALSVAEAEAVPVAASWRQREAMAATRAAPLAQLERDGLMPREWLAAARANTNEPLLLLRAD
ncbi:hypothetical protein [Pseudopontixanthobacter vadosimaris]|uniref:hypothetical protein n=1 Tax=Pseudopontixanthobacter vadosimaris TaxID=2726450 RepID=UPI0014738F4A|nr:hypothetical protein [Pseudopontixanthobacter vadosimaris]